MPEVLSTARVRRPKAILWVEGTAFFRHGPVNDVFFYLLGKRNYNVKLGRSFRKVNSLFFILFVWVVNLAFVGHNLLFLWTVVSTITLHYKWPTKRETALIKAVTCSCNQSDAEFSEYRRLRSIKDINNEKLFKEYLETVVTGQVCQKCHIFLCLG